MSARHTLLLLSSQQHCLDQLPNLGDRAMFGGLLTLIKRHGDCRVLHAPWKAFPLLTGASLGRSSAEPAMTLAAWARRLGKYSAVRTQLEDWMATRLDQPPLPWIAHATGLAAAVRRRTGVSWLDALRTRLPAHQARSFLRQIGDADAGLLCGGGIFADHLGRSLPARLFEPYLTLAAGRPTAVVSYSLSLARPSHQALARAVLPRITVHQLREPRSRPVLTELGVLEERIIDSVDTAFAMPAPARTVSAEHSRDIAIMIRGDRSVDLDAWATLVERLRQRYGVRVHYLHGSLHHDPPVRRALGRRCRLDDDGRPDDLTGLLAGLGRMAMLITDRYHGFVFALQTGTPVLPVASTTHKTAGLLDLLGQSEPVLPPLTGALLDAYLTAVDAVWEQRVSLSARGVRFADNACKQLDRDYAELFRRLWAAAARQ
ncbi:polysaccharide pyruvyl transferase family protein [Thiohalocapsa marina]|uniref:Polysaccharide pyruvyl transferase family protein n=1 Tax=Thiohalocapsa marina TaxID=424902 RepID=A0A5M8FMW9_9GAMM|nr:polysaccharide pyruvyl transferase family protein [Thiohalocapsa marina]KAA6186097.1 polysaccharide pyruvyl transferase family protein [Thiohalocapsa marina]